MSPHTGHVGWAAFRRALVPIRWVTAFSTASRALLRHPLRGALTGFGILVGVFAVTTVITLGEGAERAVQEQIERLGENLLTVRAKAAEASGVPREDKPLLSEQDARAIAAEIEGATVVAPVLDGLVRAVYRDKNTSAQAVGTTLPYFTARGYRFSSGAAWSEAEQNTSARVALVGPTIVEELFPREEPLGRSLRIGRHLFRIVGVLEAKGQTPFGMDQDNVVVVPIGAMRGKITAGRPGEVRQILIDADPAIGSAQVKRSIRSLMRQRHHIREGQADDFSVRDQARMAEAQRGVVGVMRLLLLSIAGVSLIIGGIGVMNIMLVSVAERSREIGTRLAVGARALDILFQFLIEAIVLSLLGGGAGALCTLATLGPLEEYFGWELSVSGAALSVAVVISMVIGVGFGILPAARAARLDPVAALRRE